MADVFISHIEAEKRLAAQVEEFIFMALTGPTIFRSSNNYTLRGGEQFEERIRREVLECSAFVMMCSDNSFKSHWLHVEAGAAWASGKRIIPVCYGGKTKGGLPRPYSSFQAINLDDAGDLVLALAEAVEPDAPPPMHGLSRPLHRRTKRVAPAYDAGPYEKLYALLDEIYPLPDLV